MKKIINIILTFLVLLCAWKLFPNNIVFNKWTDVILVTLILFIAGSIYSTIMTLIFSGGIILGVTTGKEGFILMVLCLIIPFIISCFIFTPVVLYFSSKYMNNFQIVGGFFTYLILAFVLHIFKLHDKTEKE